MIAATNSFRQSYSNIVKYANTDVCRSQHAQSEQAEIRRRPGIIPASIRTDNKLFMDAYAQGCKMAASHFVMLSCQSMYDTITLAATNGYTHRVFLK